MDKTIETAFFKAFDFGGVVHLCFDWLSQKYDLGFKLNDEYENKPKEELKGKWEEYYDTKLPQIINKQTAEFDDSVIKYKDSPLIDEIASNLDSLNGLQRDRYIYSLLKPFKEFSDNVHPDAIISQLKGNVNGICGISDYERDLTFWEEAKKESTDEAKADEAEKQANACRHFIKEHNYRIKRANYVANRYREICHTAFENSCNNTEQNENNNNSVEYCFECFFDVQYKFAKRLDAMLLERGVNLFWYQKECGIYLYTNRDITYLEFFLGSYELAKKYIDEALPKIQQPQQPEGNKSNEQAKRIRLKEVCELLNDIHNDINNPNKIINYVRTQIETNGHLINGVGFIDYIKSNLEKNTVLTIYGRGNSLLDKDRVGNLFELLDTLKFELSKVDNNRQNQANNKDYQQVNNGKTTGELNLPSELDTERARKYFTKAIEAQYIKVTDNGLQWVFGDSKGQVRLGYFCNKVYDTPRPINKLEEIFKVKKLSSSISNADIEAKRADVKKWRKEINDTIFND